VQFIDDRQRRTAHVDDRRAGRSRFTRDAPGQRQGGRVAEGNEAAVAGGFALPAFMGSLSTYARAGVGGLEGRKLAQGDALPLARDQAPPGTERKLGQPFDYGSGPIRIVWGPQDDHFSARGRRTFTESDYRVSREADRMGIRFEGPTIEHAVSVDKGGADIISDGIGPGAIQVPGAGLPIVLSDPDSAAAVALRGIARTLARRARGLAGRSLGLSPVSR